MLISTADRTSDQHGRNLSVSSQVADITN